MPFVHMMVSPRTKRMKRSIKFLLFFFFSSSNSGLYEFVYVTLLNCDRSFVAARTISATTRWLKFSASFVLVGSNLVQSIVFNNEWRTKAPVVLSLLRKRQLKETVDQKAKYDM
ncbi:hypothetical protein F4680DRAFT_142422 [Xylaria scruposa]|nr:hypothetical protein F4680DRAFT_142422 [Xylaria scruposa]